MTDSELAHVVRTRINDQIVRDGTAPIEMAVSAEEYDACEREIVRWLKEREWPPLPFTRSGRGILFKNVEIYPA